MCVHMGEFTVPMLYAPTRWLSLFDVALDFARQIDVLTLFYYGFLPAADRTTYLHLIVSIKKRQDIATPSQQDHLEEIWKFCASRKRTDDGKKRLEKILDGKLKHELMEFKRSLITDFRSIVSSQSIID